MDEVGSMINEVRASTYRLDNFEAEVWEQVAGGALPNGVHLHTYDSETLRSSTFHWLSLAYKSCKSIQVILQRTDDLQEHYIAENTWTEIRKVM